MDKKVLIIGGGIGGLTAGIYAAKAGFAVELYEKHGIVGGECTGWDRKGFHIDNCIHWMMGTRPGSDLNRLWETTGALGEGVKVRGFDRMYTSELNGQSVTLWADLGRTERELIALSPEDAEQIRALMKACALARGVRIPAEKPTELMGPLDGIKMAATMGAALRLFKQYEGQDTVDLMNRFRHPLIRAMISDFCTKESMAHSFPMAYGNFVSGDGGIPEGGSRAMAQRMAARLESLGGRIFTGRPASRIIVEGRKATGIALEGGEAAQGDYIVPACDTCITFGRLLPEKYMPDLLHRMYEDRKAYPVYATFQTAFALDSAEDAIGPDVMMQCPPSLRFMPEVGERLTVKSYAYEPAFAPEGKQVVQTMMGGSEAMYDYWKELSANPEAYHNKKLEIAREIQALLEERFPACRGRLTLLDSWTPMTYQRYTGAYKGFYQSFTITKHSEKLPYPPAVLDGLDNVVLAGQWITPPGGLPGAATAGKFAVQRILKKEGRSIKI